MNPFSYTGCYHKSCFGMYRPYLFLRMWDVSCGELYENGYMSYGDYRHATAEIFRLYDARQGIVGNGKVYKYATTLRD